mmetsp:Transcript_64173/g.150634  ORF Transcript_64173/g.150634 Transcript_64173/m.150634 type:complete len:301 (-) Transcript_64173:180-1082(-)
MASSQNKARSGSDLACRARWRFTIPTWLVRHNATSGASNIAVAQGATCRSTMLRSSCACVTTSSRTLLLQSTGATSKSWSAAQPRAMSAGSTASEWSICWQSCAHRRCKRGQHAAMVRVPPHTCTATAPRSRVSKRRPSHASAPTSSEIRPDGFSGRKLTAKCCKRGQNFASLSSNLRGSGNSPPKHEASTSNDSRNRIPQISRRSCRSPKLGVFQTASRRAFRQCWPKKRRQSLCCGPGTRTQLRVTRGNGWVAQSSKALAVTEWQARKAHIGAHGRSENTCTAMKSSESATSFQHKAA